MYVSVCIHIGILAALILKYECTVTKHLKKARKRETKIQQRKSEKLNFFFNYYIHREVILKFGCMLESTGDLLEISFLSQTIHQTDKNHNLWR